MPSREVYGILRIEVVFKNILLNAINNTPRSGKVLIDIDDHLDKVDFRITDMGVGITKSEKRKLFQEFGKIERYGKDQDVIIEGAGLGLYISKEIMQKH
ncbi:MAG: sensor histidine kinase [Promethearchaeota archaeon]